MKKVLLWMLGIVGVLLVVAIGALLWVGIPAKASSMAAKTVCSAAFVAGRPTTNDLFAEDVLPASPVLAVVSTDIDETAHSVTARFLGLFPRTASLVTDRGCVLGADPDATAVAYTPAADTSGGVARGRWRCSTRPSGLPGSMRLPSPRRSTPPSWAPGIPRRPTPAASPSFTMASSSSPRRHPGFENGTALHGWSMTKTLTGMLFHKLAAEKGLTPETAVVDAFPAGTEPAWVSEWRTDGRARITIADLLYMRDGLANTESYEIWGNVPQMLYAEPDMSTWAADRPSEVPAGERWQYLSATTNILSAVARAQFASDAEYWAYPRTALFDPVGAKSATLESDTAGTWVGGSYGWASATDWARFGQLMMDDGKWQGQEVLPPGWLDLATTPAVAEGEGNGYGAQTWLIGDRKSGDCRDNPGVPEDTIAMEGHWGQLVAMVPSRDAVVTRLGWTVADGVYDDCEFLAEVLAALPQ